MFLARIISDVRKELKNLNFNVDGNLNVIKLKDDKCLLSLEGEGFSYIIKYYEKEAGKESIEAQKELEKHGIKTGIVGFSSKIIVYQDYNMNGFYRVACENDLKDEKFVRKLASWYKKIHRVKSSKVKKYIDYFNLSNINLLINRLNLKNNPLLMYVINNFDNIKLKLERVCKCVVCGNYSVNDIFVSKDNSEVFVLGLDNLIEGFIGIDISFALSIVDSKCHYAFLEEYGNVSEDEIILNEVVGSIVNLFIASKNQVFPAWAKEYLALINSENLLMRAKALVEWY